jgi:hypothetical protein
MRKYTIVTIGKNIRNPSELKSILTSGYVYFPPASSQIIKTDISDGETPEMRDAWPSERGLILSSF